MDSAAEREGKRLDQLYAEAKQLVSYGANQARAIATRYREAYADVLGTARVQREELEALSGREAGPSDEERRRKLEAAVQATNEALGERQVEQSKLELVVAHLERAWLFLQQGDGSLVGERSPAAEAPTDVQMRIIEAQESERQRLAQEVHDGPAQALTNAIFQVEFIERQLDRDPAGARAEVHYLRDLLRRELGDVRAFITQLRPPLLDEIGLYGAIRDQAGTLQSSAGVSVDLDLAAPPERLGDTQQTVILRVTQEALQNIRRHAGARQVGIATRVDDVGDWRLEIEDDGRGFDADLVREGAGRSFGLRFMRERTELIGARLEIATRPGAGTRVCVTIPAGADRR
jgi:two-component system, NarL family, sensor histidine kinase DegS